MRPSLSITSAYTRPPLPTSCHDVFPRTPFLLSIPSLQSFSLALIYNLSLNFFHPRLLSTPSFSSLSTLPTPSSPNPHTPLLLGTLSVSCFLHLYLLPSNPLTSLSYFLSILRLFQETDLSSFNITD